MQQESLNDIDKKPITPDQIEKQKQLLQQLLKNMKPGEKIYEWKFGTTEVNEVKPKSNVKARKTGDGMYSFDKYQQLIFQPGCLYIAAKDPDEAKIKFASVLKHAKQKATKDPKNWN